MTSSAARALVLVPLLVLTASPALPADTDDVVNEQSEIEPADRAVPDDQSADGVAWGSFLLRPEISASLIYDNNIFATRTDEVDDLVTLVSPSARLASQWERHRLNFNAGATAARYRTSDSEDYQDYWMDGDGRYDFNADTNVFGGAGIAREHEDRSSPDASLVGSEPTRFDTRRAHGGVAHRHGRFGIRLGGTLESLDYRDVAPTNNDDRDRDVVGIGARFTYRLSARHVLFSQLIRDARDYDAARDDNGFDRDSHGTRIAVGLNGVFSNRLSGSAYVGQLHQAYDQPTFADTRALDFNGRLKFRASPTTDLNATLERTLEETTLAGASGYLYTAARLEATRRIDARLRAFAGVSAASAAYHGIEREDDLYSAEAGLHYRLSPRLYVAVTYRIDTRDANQREAILNQANVQDLDDYSRQQLFVTLGTLLYPVHDKSIVGATSLDAPPIAATDWHGLFVGGHLVHGSSWLHGTGLRGGSGIDQGEYADEGAGAGLFAGYGRSFGRWYAGIEADAEDVATDIYHRKDKADSRTLHLARERAYGVSLRGGYRLAGGDLLYLRLGRVRGKFDTYYTLNDAPQNAVDTTLEQDGTRYGVGTDVVAGAHLFIRMDYSHTDYDGFVADLITDREAMTPAESYFRLGLGWQFGGTTAPPKRATPMAMRGFYAGALLGHGSLNSHAAGTHSDSGGSGGGGRYDFNGDFGHNAGFTGGIFAGWGTTWRHWYGGIEATSETGTAEWSHVRDPNGRSFSVEKQDTYGLGLRGGYQLRTGTLLYAHADRVRTRFNTDWSKGANSGNDVDRDDRVHGTRIGVGADIPATRSWFVRMDYSHTEYDDYGFTTEHGNPDSMRFSNSDTLFRLGLGTRF